MSKILEEYRRLFPCTILKLIGFSECEMMRAVNCCNATKVINCKLLRLEAKMLAVKRDRSKQIYLIYL